MLQRIEDAGYTLLAMTNLSTTLFRMERGVYELRPEKMDLAAVARKVLAGFAETAEMRGVGLRLLVDGRDDSPSHPLDGRGTALPLHARQPRGNALDASPGGRTFWYPSGSAEGGGASTSSTGRRVAPELQGRFFEKYATAGKARGTGLGTYSARLIARAHGGDIEMKCGAGTVEVSVFLPA